jgi:Carbohydrate binding module (family 35)
VAQKWYQKATVQAALAAGTLALVAVIFGPLISGTLQQLPTFFTSWLRPPRPCSKAEAGKWRYYEAEASELSGDASSDSEHQGYSGTGYISGFGHGHPGTGAAFSVEVPSSGEYDVDLCYANASGSTKTLTIYVNGERLRQTRLPNDSRWNLWLIRTERLPLRSGLNTISYRKDPSDNGGVNLDFIRVAGE